MTSSFSCIGTIYINRCSRKPFQYGALAEQVLSFVGVVICLCPKDNKRRDVETFNPNDSPLCQSGMACDLPTVFLPDRSGEPASVALRMAQASKASHRFHPVNSFSRCQRPEPHICCRPCVQTAVISIKNSIQTSTKAQHHDCSVGFRRRTEAQVR